MAKLAFLSLFLSTLLITISASPVSDLQARTRNGRTSHFYEQDGLIRQVDNQMDRGRSFGMDYDYEMNAGNPLENEFIQESKPTAPTKEDKEYIINRLICDLDVKTDEKAEKIVDKAYDRLPDWRQEALVSEDKDTYMKACSALLEKYYKVCEEEAKEDMKESEEEEEDLD